jgi:DNA-directed RNA polymerase specialized sigma24 family protein
MLRTEKRETASFRAEYATHADFCQVLESDTNSLYLLTFLLTADHQKAEHCFVSAVEEVFRARAVFKEWARSWVRRCLIKNAIRMVSPVAARNSEQRDLGGLEEEEYGSPAGGEIDAVTRLSPLERFVFVISVLERYSSWDCSLLLGCSMNQVAQARLRALRALPGPDAFPLHPEAGFTNSLHLTA